MGHRTACLASLVVLVVIPADAQVTDASTCAVENGTYAADASWFINKEPLEIDGIRLVRHGMPVVGADNLAPSRNEGVATLYRGVPLYEGYAPDRDTVLTYVPVRGCEFQGYEYDSSELQTRLLDDDTEIEVRELTLPAHVLGALGAEDLTSTDGRFKEDFDLRISGAITLLISLVSVDTNPYLELWTLSDSGELVRVSFNDDAENMGNGSRLTAELDPYESYFVRATTSAAGGSGRFIIDIREHEPEVTSKGLRMSDGELTSTDTRLANGAYYDDWVIDLEVGERMVITMASEQFDSYLRVGEDLGGEFVVREENDDSGGMVLGSRVELFGTRNDNKYTVRASSLGEALGAYVVTFETFSAL